MSPNGRNRSIAVLDKLTGSYSMYQLLYKLNEHSEYRLYAEYKSIDDKAIMTDSMDLLLDFYIIKLEEI
jgi:hypothetical protein